MLDLLFVDFFNLEENELRLERRRPLSEIEGLEELVLDSFVVLEAELWLPLARFKVSLFMDSVRRFGDGGSKTPKLSPGAMVEDFCTTRAC